MGDTKDKKKMQSDKAARKVKEQGAANRLKPNTAPGKGPEGEGIAISTPSRPKKGNK